jgi:hypothetical protein
MWDIVRDTICGNSSSAERNGLDGLQIVFEVLFACRFALHASRKLEWQ